MHRIRKIGLCAIQSQSHRLTRSYVWLYRYTVISNAALAAYTCMCSNFIHSDRRPARQQWQRRLATWRVVDVTVQQHLPRSDQLDVGLRIKLSVLIGWHSPMRWVRSPMRSVRARWGPLRSDEVNSMTGCRLSIHIPHYPHHNPDPNLEKNINIKYSIDKSFNITADKCCCSPVNKVLGMHSGFIDSVPNQR